MVAPVDKRANKLGWHRGFFERQLTVNNCASAAEYPRPFMIVGRKPETLPSPKFTVVLVN